MAAAAMALATAGLTTACGSGSADPAPLPSGSLAASADGRPEPLTIPITIAGGQVEPNGTKMTAELGQQVVLVVTSDEADEIHAHTGGDGYELEVPANQPTTGSFTPSQPGSFEVESHHLGKVIVILNVS
ncbi:MAG: hypothetical protein ACRYG2_26360 [Janthinobacterium lividum]